MFWQLVQKNICRVKLKFISSVDGIILWLLRTILEICKIYYDSLCSFRLKGDRNAYDEVISGQAETLDILTFVKENMENG